MLGITLARTLSTGVFREASKKPSEVPARRERENELNRFYGHGAQPRRIRKRVWGYTHGQPTDRPPQPAGQGEITDVQRPAASNLVVLRCLIVCR